jgi:hypothetical protein
MKKVLAESLGYIIIGHGYGKHHYCFSFKEALSWAGCYKAASIYRYGTWYADHRSK